MQSVTSNGVANALGYLVWENPAPSQNFQAQTITFDRVIPNNFSRIRVLYRNYQTATNYECTESEIGINFYLTLNYVTTTGTQVSFSRLVTNTTRNNIDVAICQCYTSDAGYYTDTNRLIPVKIWAIK